MLLQNHTGSVSSFFQKCTGGYRYGFNGKEKDDDVAGAGNTYDFGARIYDSRLGRWLSVDVLQKKYPSLSAYQFCANNPIFYLDPDGKIIRIYFNGGYYDYTPGIEPKDKNDVRDKVIEAIKYNMNTDIGKEVWNGLAKAEQVIEIKPIKDGVSRYDPENLGKKTTEDNKVSLGTIYWDYNTPFCVLTQGDGDGDYSGYVKGYFAPSTIIIHEGGHSLKALSILLTGDPNKMEAFKASFLKSYGGDSQYESKGEKSNIEDVEQPYIKQINAWEQQNNSEDPQYQPVRYNHEGSQSESVKVGVNQVFKSNEYKEFRKAESGAGRKVDDGVK